MNQDFIRRERCPCCATAESDQLCSVAYGETLMKEYLDRFYAEVGSINHARLEGSDYTLLECRGCGAVYQEDIPNDALSNRFYEEWISPQKAFELYERNRNINSYSFLARSVEVIIRHLGKTPSSLKLIDFGMGWGHWSMFAAAFGCEAFGVEISPERIRYAESHGIKVLGYEEMAAHKFDCINAEQVFEHLPSPLETLQYLESTLAPGGLIWISVPDGGDIKARLKHWDWKAPKDSAKSLNAVAPLEHLICYNHDVLVDMAARAGLKPIQVPAKNASRRHGPETRAQRIARILRRVTGLADAGSATTKPEFNGTSLFFTQA